MFSSTSGNRFPRSKIPPLFSASPRKAPFKWTLDLGRTVRLLTRKRILAQLLGYAGECGRKGDGFAIVDVVGTENRAEKAPRGDEPPGAPSSLLQDVLPG